GVEPRVVAYLTDTPTAAEIDRVLGLLGKEPREVMRTKEAAYKEAGLDDPSLSRTALIDAMVAHPILIERPIVIRKDRAALGRPPENVLPLLD
ncbi:MAG TPA: ArsC/Spx/MgsR family protein, partial [Kofleriaceae bacterium]|nr:ArsC/Spx/MgsR family protein [Kofleriaceae bacterium]